MCVCVGYNNYYYNYAHLIRLYIIYTSWSDEIDFWHPPQADTRSYYDNNTMMMFIIIILIFM